MNRITVGPLFFFSPRSTDREDLMQFGAELEAALSDSASLYVGTQLSVFGMVIQNMGYDYPTLLWLTGGVHFYAIELAPKGLWLGPEGSVALGPRSPLGALGLQASIGYTFINMNGFTISIGTALGACLRTKLSVSDPLIAPSFGGRANLGHAF